MWTMRLPCPGGIILRRAGMFEVKCESLSFRDVSFLDLFIYKGAKFERSGFLDYRLYEKPTKIWVPLSKESAHHSSVHNSWPSSMICRIN